MYGKKMVKRPMGGKVYKNIVKDLWVVKSTK